MLVECSRVYDEGNGVRFGPSLGRVNAGYGAGNDLAIRSSDAVYHLVLNPDGAVFDMFLRSGVLSIVRGVFKSRMDRFEMRDMDYLNTISPVPYPAGCCMFFRGKGWTA